MCASKIKKNEENDAENNKKNRKIGFSDLRNPPTIFAPLFGKLGKRSTAHSNTTRTKGENK